PGARDPASASGHATAAIAADRALAAIEAAPSSAESYKQAGGVLASAAQAERVQQATSQLASASGRSTDLPSPSTPGTAIGSAAGMDHAAAGPEQSPFSRLSDQLRRNVRAQGVERFSEEHQEAIRAYLRRLGEQR
nr:hypothetical protein [Planctomycetota bacterium]